MTTREFLSRAVGKAEELRRAGAVLSGEAAAHAHLASASRSVPGAASKYPALGPTRLEAVLPEGTEPIAEIGPDRSAIADLVRSRLDLFGTTVALADGTRIPVVTREAAIAQLLVRGGLALGLAGLMLRFASPPIDPDDVREILKAARQGERFQPLLELLDVVA